MPETRSERIRLPVEIDDRIDSRLVTAHAGGGAAGDRAVPPRGRDTGRQ